MGNKCYLCKIDAEITKSGHDIAVHCRNCGGYIFNQRYESQANLLGEIAGKDYLLQLMRNYYDDKNVKHPPLYRMDDLLVKMTS